MSKINWKQKFRLALPIVVFTIFYLAAFSLLEKIPLSACHEIYSRLDGMIPFCEYFVIPYFMWFAYVPFVAVVQLFTDEDEFRRLSAILIFGMSFFLLFNFVFPTVLNIRPWIMPRNNTFCRLTSMLYRIDTPTNVFPSIHVFNTIAVLVSVFRSRGTHFGHAGVRLIHLMISLLIVLSTMFLKQHSVIDVIFGFILIVISEKLEAFRSQPRYARYNVSFRNYNK